MADFLSARAKLRHSEGHFESFKKQTRRFHGSNPYPVTHERDIKSGEHRFRIKVRKHPPLEDWALLVGDCVHNARVALDHVVWQLSGADPIDTSSQFPIFIDPDMFERHGLRPIKRLDRRGKAFIKWLQPYRRDNPDAESLWHLQLLDASDKHKLLAVASSIMDESEVKIDAPAYSHVRHRFDYSFGEFEDNAIIAEGFVIAQSTIGGPTRYDVKVKGKFAFGVSIHDPTSKLTLIGAETEIPKILTRVDTILSAAERLF